MEEIQLRNRLRQPADISQAFDGLFTATLAQAIKNDFYWSRNAPNVLKTTHERCTWLFSFSSNKKPDDYQAWTVIQMMRAAKYFGIQFDINAAKRSLPFLEQLDYENADLMIKGGLRAMQPMGKNSSISGSRLSNLEKLVSALHTSIEKSNLGRDTLIETLVEEDLMGESRFIKFFPEYPTSADKIDIKRIFASDGLALLRVAEMIGYDQNAVMEQLNNIFFPPKIEPSPATAKSKTTPEQITQGQAKDITQPVTVQIGERTYPVLRSAVFSRGDIITLGGRELSILLDAELSPPQNQKSTFPAGSIVGIGKTNYAITVDMHLSPIPSI